MLFCLSFQKVSRGLASKQLAWQLGSNMSAFRFLMLISHRPLMNRTTWFSQYRQCKVGCTPYKTSSWRAYNENSHRSYRCRCSMKVHYMALFTPIAWIERQRTCPRCQPSTPYSLASVLQDPKSNPFLDQMSNLYLPLLHALTTSLPVFINAWALALAFTRQAPYKWNSLKRNELTLRRLTVTFQLFVGGLFTRSGCERDLKSAVWHRRGVR